MILNKQRYTHLHVGARIPVWVEQYDPVCTRKVDAHPAGPSSQQHHEYRLVAVKTVNQVLRSRETARENREQTL